jgi:signal transduction histidine kinase
VLGTEIVPVLASCCIPANQRRYETVGTGSHLPAGNGTCVSNPEIRAEEVLDLTAGDSLSREQYRRLFGVIRSLVSELDLEALLRGVLTAARDLTGAGYAALGVLNEEKAGLERFVFLGVDEEARRQIGSLPRGKGVLGELIRDPRPLRLSDVSSHPRSYGFPPGHPRMGTFLGVPIMIRGEAWGNLYLTEKAGGGEFTEGDEALAVLLSQWAAIAIENARLYSTLARRSGELERAVHALEAGADVSRSVARGSPLEELTGLIAKRARDLLSARVAVVLLSDDAGLRAAAAAGEGAKDIEGRAVHPGEPLIADALRLSGVRNLSSGGGRSIELPGLEASGSHVLMAPLEFRDRPPGLIVLIDRTDGLGFGDEEESLLKSFAANAAATIATARAVEADRLRLAIEAGERERSRWARELHDETLQDLGALRLALQAEAGGDDAERLAAAVARIGDRLDDVVARLQALVNELRPAALDQLGLGAALESLVARTSEHSGLRIEPELRLAFEEGRSAERLPPDLEATVFRIAQEGLNNVVKHAGASSAQLAVVEKGGTIRIGIRDDGVGFDPSATGGGFGLVGMHERVRLAQGSLQIESAPGRGTEVRAELPVPATPSELPPAGERPPVSTDRPSR